MGKIRAIKETYRDGGIKPTIAKVRNYFISGGGARYTKSILGKKYHHKLYMYERLGYWPQIRNPRTFNEKLMHRKLYTDNPQFARVEDKWAVREFVAERVSEDILPEVYYLTENPEAIPFDSLPEEFVIKPTHLSGPVTIIDKEETPNSNAIVEDCWEWLDRTHGKMKGEYWYSDIQPKIIIEERLRGVEFDIPRDFKFYVFHGQVEYVHVDLDRYSEHKRRFYDKDWNPQSFELEYPLGEETQKPREFDRMKEIAEILGRDFDFVRVDIYETKSQGIMFGELTIAPGSGGEEFRPIEYDFEFGDLW